MDLSHLQYFMQLCADRNISKAAESLSISQQGLSKALIRLEQEIGAPLFIRGHREIALTPAGESLKKHAQYILATMENLQQEISRLTRAEQPVRVGLSNGVMFLLSAAVGQQSDFDQYFAPHKIELIEALDDQCEELVESEAVHLALTARPINENRFNALALRDFPLCCVINRRHPLAGQPAVSLADLQGQPLLTGSKASKLYSLLTSHCRQLGFEPNIVSHTLNSSTIYLQAELNMGIGVTVDHLHCAVTLPPSVTIRPLAESLCWSICLITKKDRLLPLSEQQIREKLVKLFR